MFRETLGSSLCFGYRTWGIEKDSFFAENLMTERRSKFFLFQILLVVLHLAQKEKKVAIDFLFILLNKIGKSVT